MNAYLTKLSANESQAAKVLRCSSLGWMASTLLPRMTTTTTPDARNRARTVFNLGGRHDVRGWAGAQKQRSCRTTCAPVGKKAYCQVMHLFSCPLSFHTFLRRLLG